MRILAPPIPKTLEGKIKDKQHYRDKDLTVKQQTHKILNNNRTEQK